VDSQSGYSYFKSKVKNIEVTVGKDLTYNLPKIV